MSIHQLQVIVTLPVIGLPVLNADISGEGPIGKTARQSAQVESSALQAAGQGQSP